MTFEVLSTPLGILGEEKKMSVLTINFLSIEDILT